MIELTPLPDADYRDYVARTIRDYADEKARAGNWPAADALHRAETQFAEMLPQGSATPGHFFYAIREAATGTQVGVLWWARVTHGAEPSAFIYDFVIFEPFRRQGFAAAALQALEAKVRAEGLATIALHVFGHNHGARALYERAGFQPTNINMEKRLAPGG